MVKHDIQVYPNSVVRALLTIEQKFDWEVLELVLS